MPNRLIRSDMLDSEAVLRQPAEGRWLFVAIMLMADDLGLFEATEFHLARKASLARESVPMLLQSLVDSDLVRLYQGPGMRTLGFIPKFGQRLQITRAKFPLPPAALYADDEDAARKFKHLASKTSVGHGGPTVGHGDPPPEAEVEEKSTTTGSANASPVVVAGESGDQGDVKVVDEQALARAVAKHCPHELIVKLYHELLPELNAVSKWDERRQGYSRQRWREAAIEHLWPDQDAGLRYFAKFFRYVRTCPHLMGKTKPRDPDGVPFQADLEWLLRPTNHRKVIEGKYQP